MLSHDWCACPVFSPTAIANMRAWKNTDKEISPHLPLSNSEVAAGLEEVASLLEKQGQTRSVFEPTESPPSAFARFPSRLTRSLKTKASKA